MKNIYSREYNNRSSKVATGFACLGIIAATVAIQVILVIAIIIAILIMKAFSMHDLSNFKNVVTEMLSGSDFISKLTVLITAISLVIALILYYFIYVNKDKKKGIYESVLPKLKNMKVSGSVLCMTVAGFALTSILAIFISSVFPEQADKLNSTFSLFQLSGPLYYLDILLIGPVFEELVVRGIILKMSKRSFGMIGCMVISAVSFSVIHGNIIQGFYVIPMGILYGFIAFQFNSVIPSIFCHMLHNLLATVITWDGTIGIIIYTVLILIVGFLAYYLGRDHFPMFEQDES
ncbi:MAG: CPBP family intramembrane metalloprotease [Lachnospiraceae bacterium]|nr:CPBP family intramembrane metalloprotease [Lachnospiraceae bacterium]